MKLLSAFCIIAIIITAPAFGARRPAPTPSEKTGPIGKGTPRTAWGCRVKDEVNGQWLWFGGVGGLSKEGGLRTWIFKAGAWKRVEFKASAEFTDVEKLRLKARGLYAAVANRYYVSETEKARKVKLDAEYKKLIAGLGKLALKDAGSKKLLVEAKSGFLTLAGKVGGKLSVAEVAAARASMMRLVQLGWTLSSEPPLRCYPNMAFDKKTGKIVLFGGEGVYGAYNDTWIYDCKTRKWSLADIKLAPPPRLGHGMIARDGKVYLAGGFTPRGSMSYCGSLWWRLPVDIWSFDIKTFKWTLLKKGTGKKKYTKMQPRLNLSISGDGSKLSWNAPLMAYGKKRGEVTGEFALLGSDAGTADVASPAGSIHVRELGFDPAWYEKVPPADQSKFQAFLKTMPSNKWVNVSPPVRHVNRDWGTTVLDIHRDQLLHWAGGHSSHCGTDVAHFSLATGRWHILYTPELPFEACYSNDGAHYPAMSGNRPWGPHSYLSYAYDHVSQKMIWAGRHGAYRLTNPQGLWIYDPQQYEWSASKWKFESGKLDIERHKTCMVPTPHGVATWGDKRGGTGGQTGLWMAKVVERVFKPVVATDPKDRTTLPHTAYGDRHGITYDSKRDRALIMHFGHKQKYKIWAVDLKSKKVTVLEPKGSKSFPMGLSMARECTYIPDFDQVIVPARGSKGTPQKLMVYDCARDQWLKMPNPCSKPDKRGRIHPGYGVSTGVEWDARRKLLWLVQTNGSVYAMRYQPKSAGLQPIAK
jgi:Galactose oxidase, central domain